MNQSKLNNSKLNKAGRLDFGMYPERVGEGVVKVLFKTSFPIVPKIFHCISGFDADSKYNLRIKTEIREVTNEYFVIHFNSWADSKTWNIGVDWVATIDENIQIGNECFEGDIASVIDEDFPRNFTSGRIYEKYISFPSPYSKPPLVAAAFNSLDLGSDSNIRVKADVKDITENGFTLTCNTFGNDAITYLAKITYIVVDTESGFVNNDDTFRHNHVDFIPKADENLILHKLNHNYQPNSETGGSFAKELNVNNGDLSFDFIAGLSIIDFDSYFYWRIRSYPSNITASSCHGNVDTWNDSKIYSARAAVIGLPCYDEISYYKYGTSPDLHEKNLGINIRMPESNKTRKLEIGDVGENSFCSGDHSADSRGCNNIACKGLELCVSNFYGCLDFKLNETRKALEPAIKKLEDIASGERVSGSSEEANMAKIETLYDGPFLNGKYHGFGKLYYPNNLLRYEGHFQKGFYNGHGKLYHKMHGGLHYVGEFKDGKLHGFGKQFYATGAIKYKGLFENGQYHGHGKLFTEYRNLYLSINSSGDVVGSIHSTKWTKDERKFKSSSGKHLFYDKDLKKAIMVDSKEMATDWEFSNDSIKIFGEETYLSFDKDIIWFPNHNNSWEKVKQIPSFSPEDGSFSIVSKHFRYKDEKIVEIPEVMHYCASVESSSSSSLSSSFINLANENCQSKGKDEEMDSIEICPSELLQESDGVEKFDNGVSFSYENISKSEIEEESFTIVCHHMCTCRVCAKKSACDCTLCIPEKN